MSSLQASSRARSRIFAAAFVFVLLALVFVLRRQLLDWFMPARHASVVSAQAPRDEHVDHYTCSMHPAIKQSEPGKCPICGMALVPVSKDEAAQGVVSVDETRRQLGGVRTAEVALLPMRSTFRASGRVTYDESSIHDVTAKVSGFVTKLFANQTGQRVKRGQPLLSFYSPEIYAAEQDFLLALRSAERAAPLANAARKRLSLLGLADAQIEAISARSEVSENATLSSPASGFVVDKDIVEGSAVQAGMRLFRIAALDKVWIDVDIYEADLARVRVGQAVKVTLEYVPDRVYEAKLAYVYPYLESAARTGRVRIELGNRELLLKPGMFANVELALDAGNRLQVPSSAVVFTGPRRLVFVDIGEGRFRPQEVRIGNEAGDNYEVLDGLQPGDRVAVAGVFLLAAEARIRGASKFWEHEPEAAAAAPPSAPLPAPPSATPSSAHVAKKPAAEPAPALDYTCPMHPEVHSNAPGACPKCGMDLVPRGKP